VRTVNKPSLGVRARVLARRARAVARVLAHPRASLAARREAVAIARAHPGLAAELAASERPDGQRILVVSLSDSVQQVRLEAILAKALQLHGGRVTILTWRSAWRARAIFRRLHLRDVVFYDDFARPMQPFREEAGRALESCATVRELLRFEYDGARIGRQALSTIVRARHEPRVELDAPGVRDELRETLAYAMEGTGRGRRILEATRPDQLLLVERGYASFGPIFDVALERGVRVVQFQSAHRDDAFQLKRYDLETRELHPRSLDARTWERLLAGGLTEERERRLEAELAAREEGKWFMARRIRHSGRRRGPEELRRELGLDERKVAVLFSHVLWDASMFYGRDLYPDQGRWFEETVKLAAADDSVQWLVKLHPALFWKLRSDGVAAEAAEFDMIRDAVGELPSHMRVLRPDDDVDNEDLFRIIDAGVTIRGTVGLELPRLGVPVLTAGTSDYSGRGFTVDAETVEEYERNVRAIATLPRLTEEQMRAAKLYAYGIFCVRPWRFRSFALDFLPVGEAGDTLEHRLRYGIATREELERADDLADFARWVLESDDADYVNEAELAVSRTVNEGASVSASST
jgi:hypothetical protein